MLRYFGMETREKALGTMRWVLPYLAILGLGLAVASFLVQRFLGLSVAACAAGAALSAGYFFLFLARMRQAALASEQT